MTDQPTPPADGHDDRAGTTLTRETVEPVVARARFDDAGLLPAIIQDAVSRDVLMMGWMDAEALRRTLTEGRVTRQMFYPDKWHVIWPELARKHELASA